MSKGSQPQVMSQNVPKYDANQQQLMNYLTDGTAARMGQGSQNTIRSTGQNYMSPSYNPSAGSAAAQSGYNAQPAPVRRQNNFSDAYSAIAQGMDPAAAILTSTSNADREYERTMNVYKSSQPYQPTPQEQKYFDYLSDPTYLNNYVMDQLPRLDIKGSTDRINEQFDPTALAKQYSASMMPIAQQNWETYGRPQVQASYAGPGYYGTARNEALRKSLTDVNNNVNTGMINNVYSPTLQARGNALSNLYSADYDQTKQFGNYSYLLNSAIPQQWKSAADMTRSYQTMEADPNIAQIYKILGIDPYNTVGGVVAGQPNTWGSVLGSLLGVAGSLGSAILTASPSGGSGSGSSGGGSSGGGGGGSGSG